MGLPSFRWPVLVLCAGLAGPASGQTLSVPDVPFVAQSEALCGGAALAMVLRYWGTTGVQAEDFAGDSDDIQSWGYVNRAKEVYKLLGVGDRLEYVSTTDGHNANGPSIDPAWRAFFMKWLR